MCGVALSRAAMTIGSDSRSAILGPLRTPLHDLLFVTPSVASLPWPYVLARSLGRSDATFRSIMAS